MAALLQVLLTETKIKDGHSEGIGEFIWTVPNMISVSKTIQSLTAYRQEVSLEVGLAGLCLAKVELGFYVNGDHFAPRLKILDTHGQSQPDLSVCVALLLDNGDESRWSQMIETSVSAESVLEFPNVRLTVGVDETCWKNFLTRSKACAFKVKLTLTYENVRDIRETQLEALQESCTKGLLRSLENVWGNPDFQDVSIICRGDREIRANLFLLVLRCPTIRSRFPGVVEKQTSEIHVPQIERDVMEILLKFLYTGKLSKGWCEVGIIENFTFAVGLFGVTELLDFLDQALGENKKIENTLGLLKFAEKFNLHMAKEKIKGNLLARATFCKNSEELEALFGTYSLEEPKFKRQLPEKN